MANPEIDKSKKNEHPGPQKKIASKSFIRSPIHYLILSAFILTLFAITKSNTDIQEANSILDFELLDIQTSISLLMATISLLYARNQFEQSFMPILDYRITYSDKNALDFTSRCSDKNYLVCSLKNLSAVAVVESAKYIVHTRSSGAFECYDYHDFIRILNSHNIKNKEDFSMVYISKGWAIGGNDERVIFELITENYQENKELTGIDIELEFRSLLGDIYKKEIFCIPRRGVSI